MISVRYKLILRASTVQTNTYDTIFYFDTLMQLKRALSHIKLADNDYVPSNYKVEIDKVEYYYDATDHLIKQRTTDVTSSVLGG